MSFPFKNRNWKILVHDFHGDITIVLVQGYEKQAELQKTSEKQLITRRPGVTFKVATLRFQDRLGEY